MRFTPRPRVKPDSVLDGLTTAVVAIDGELRIAALNAASESLFGISRRHAIGVPVATGLPQFAAHAPRLQEALDAGSGFIERELRLARNGETPITVDCTVTPLLFGKGPGLLMEVNALDRHLRISRDELMLAQHEASRELIRGMAHEIKNPLGGIRGAAQLMEAEFPDNEHREYTRVIIREVDRLQNLVNRMLGPNRAPEAKPLNIHEVLEHCRQLVVAEASEGFDIIRDYDPSLPEVSGDREQLIQAVLNILRNALQATGGKGAVRIRTRSRRQLTIGNTRHRLVLQVDIVDDGPGIPDELQDKIFYPMVTTRAEGTGLGLPIAQYLIHAHNGLLECHSQPGQTRFTIYLPMEAAG